ncbi:acid-sensing system DNA-binding response regulator EvgA [Klebsiella sp. BIGb0407]|uniref:acid-sensing system DNA-binding response regulator EvgA n=1 Tax=Klebsiella sp. BIGb0407 TaxID=2940603 RepID=UPI00216940D5|nr:acid-sensing system DNA-binding response regulator EvgA [Klebsiella sp. BIGb0407]MCS3431188.1 two-component system response regulator EvgA [Klebsiella sp. BIGb0407]
MNAIIVDNHPLALIAIRSILERNNIDVLAEASDGRAGLKLINELKPDIAIIDVDLPVKNGIEIVEALRKNKSTCIFIIISAKSDFFYGKKCFEAGANAYISKKKGIQDIISAIDAAVNGYIYFPLTLNALNITLTSEEGKIDSLSSQEVRVMGYLLKGMDISSISMKMNISYKTVSTYKRRLMEKLGCSNLLELYGLSNRNRIG